MTMQEIYDLYVWAALSGVFPGLNERGNLVYYAEHSVACDDPDLKSAEGAGREHACAIGILILDEVPRLKLAHLSGSINHLRAAPPTSDGRTAYDAACRAVVDFMPADSLLYWLQYLHDQTARATLGCDSFRRDFLDQLNGGLLAGVPRKLKCAPETRPTWRRGRE